jgi:hypothetical protein
MSPTHSQNPFFFFFFFHNILSNLQPKLAKTSYGRLPTHFPHKTAINFIFLKLKKNPWCALDVKN